MFFSSPSILPARKHIIIYSEICIKVLKIKSVLKLDTLQKYRVGGSASPTLSGRTGGETARGKIL